MAIDAALGRLGIRPGVCTSSTRPANPFEGQVIYETDTNNIRFWSGSAWESNKGGIVSSSAPTGAAAGDIWYDSDDGRAYIYYDDGSSQQWVEFGAPPSGSTIALASYADSAARTTAIPSPTEADLSYLQDTNSVEVYDGSAWASIAPTGGIAIFNETQSSATSGGTFSSGSWVKRTLNTTVVNTISGASLASSVITLPAGTYEVHASAPAFDVDRHVMRIRDTTNTTTLARGNPMYASATHDVSNQSIAMGHFTLAGSADIEVQHRCQTGKAGNGLGVEGNFGDNEVYTRITIREF
jgi:hypothetical protein